MVGGLDPDMTGCQAAVVLGLGFGPLVVGARVKGIPELVLTNWWMRLVLGIVLSLWWVGPGLGSLAAGPCGP